MKFKVYIYVDKNVKNANLNVYGCMSYTRSYFYNKSLEQHGNKRNIVEINDGFDKDKIPVIIVDVDGDITNEDREFICCDCEMAK